MNGIPATVDCRMCRWFDLLRMIGIACFGYFAFSAMSMPLCAQTEPQEDISITPFAGTQTGDFVSGNALMYSGRNLESIVPQTGRKHFEHIAEEYGFENDTEGWGGINRVKARIRDGSLVIEADRQQPAIYRNFQVSEGAEIRIQFRMRTSTRSDCVLYWQTSVSPRQSDDKTARVSLTDDGQWHDYEIALPVRGALTSLTLLFTATEGSWEMDDLRLWINELHPLVIVKVTSVGDNLEYTVRNHGNQSVTFMHDDRNYKLDGEQEVRLTVTPVVRDCYHVFRLRLVPENYPEIEYSAFRYNPEIACRWYVLPLGDYHFFVTESGAMALIRPVDGGPPFAVIAPFVHDESLTPSFALETDVPLLEQAELNNADVIAAACKAAREKNNTLAFVADDVRLVVRTIGTEIHVDIESRRPFEGPVVRAIGSLRSGLLSGCELLGENDISASEIDVDPAYVNRFAPPLNWVTMPLMAIGIQVPEKSDEYEVMSDRIIALSWEDAETQPTFSIPNGVDAVDDMRMSLRDRQKVRAVIYFSDGDISDAILWHLRRNGLPDIPDAPRSLQEQNALTLAAFRGPLAGSDGVSWGFCAEPEWPRQSYDSIASTIWHLSGLLPTLLETPVFGGSAIPNETYYFLTGRPLDLVDTLQERAKRIMEEMRSDDSFLFPTRFPDFEPNEPSAGYCARRTLELMTYARLTGDRHAFQHVAKSIESMKRFRTPRGGYYWETSQHTPDLLAAAHMVILHVWAYEFSGDESYLERARYWALMGVPFVYLRDESPHMLYATVPMYGASERESPLWFGTAQPWCGCVYAYGIAMLSRYDRTVDWQKLARGILHSAESLQFESGPYIGCLPNGFSLDTQEAISWKLNPAVLASLRRMLDLSYDNYIVIHDRNIRVASPFPVKLTRDGVIIEGAREGLNYQILVNGSQVIDIYGNKEGRNFVPLK